MTELSPAMKRELRAAARHLNARITIGRAGVSDALVAQVRSALEKHALLKVRVVGDRQQAERVGAELAARVPCALVGRIGFVVTLYRPSPGGEAAGGVGGEGPL